MDNENVNGGSRELAKRTDRKNCLKHAAQFLCFLLAAAFMGDAVSWPYRANAIEARQDIVGFENIEGNIDVVAVGASDILRYYMPLQAFHDYGYTSYNYATSSGSFDMLRYYIEQVRKSQSPELFIIGSDSLSLVSSSDDEQAIRNWADSLGVFSPVRWKSIHSYMENRDTESIDVLPYYYDIAKYHNNIPQPMAAIKLTSS